MKQKRIKPLEIDLGAELIQGLKEIVEGRRDGDRAKLTRRTVTHIEPPPVLRSKDLKGIRATIAMSQSAFADFVGVSPQLVRAWEQGQRKPSKLACRLLDEMRRNPKYWQEKVQAR